MKKLRPFLSPPGRLALSLVLGILTAWLLRQPWTSLLMGGKEFAGRSLPVQAALLLGLALAAAALWAVILHYYGEQLADFLKSIPVWLQTHPEITLILFLTFVARFFLADWNSYWYDELVEVQTASGEGNSALAIARSMMGTDRHPPLYQISLFYWIRLFGDSEVATRMLSTLLVTLAVLLLYLLAERLYGKRTAIAAALFFSLSNMAVAYSLESRAYALTLFLSCLSSYLLLRYLSSLNRDLSWRRLLLNTWYVLLVLVNAAMPLTHYYNAYFLLAQAVFVLFLALSWVRWHSILPVMIKVAVLYAIQLAVFAALWGYAFLQAFESRGTGLESLNIPAGNPFSLFAEYVVAPNFYNLPGAVWGILLLFLFALAGMGRFSPAPDNTPREGLGDSFRIYLLLWAVLPLVFSTMSSLLVQPPFLNARYFIYCTPPLMLLVVLGLEQVVVWIDQFTRRRFNQSAWEHYNRNALVYAIIAASILVLPRGYDAAISRKHDWRGSARQLAALIQSDPGKSYLIIEPSHRSTPLLDYYLQRFSSTIRVADVLTVAEENKLAGGEITRPGFMQRQDLAGSDYLVVEFIHFRKEAFPQSLELLKETYPIKLQSLDNEGRGFVIFDLQAAGE